MNTFTKDFSKSFAVWLVIWGVIFLGCALYF